jgi:hypothetical protein
MGKPAPALQGAVNELGCDCFYESPSNIGLIIRLAPVPGMNKQFVNRSGNFPDYSTICQDWKNCDSAQQFQI